MEKILPSANSHSPALLFAMNQGVVLPVSGTSSTYCWSPFLLPYQSPGELATAAINYHSPDTV